ncbi:antibiotic biosynthesis monooxygenase family protein [Gilvimarinus algae]|uniref:Antibiotic biosynthesis monooxygenase n=1 Tax=Gilvimarinus algae TaxID=3058037 RepID=A0ABT8T8X9_9GAMM|nr:antibiotic biosynthesis monooxygenase [Gilvimarinus sp. SDUM040014]MDO3380585.1 antibiotic biosynthesis monooxygenase [Gilvimarinus sp. SDUM040014]
MIYVLVERHIADGMESTYDLAARQALEAAHRAPGFINGETLEDLQRPNHRYLLSKWRSLHDWKQWYYSDERHETLNQLNPTLADFEKITLLQK